MVESTSFQGLHVPTIYDHDGDPGTPPIDPHDLQLADAGFRIVTTAMASSRDPEPFSGAISVAVLNLERKMVLQPNGVYAMARMTIRVKVPGHGQPPASVRLRYRNGLFTGGTSVRNLVTLGSTYWIPRTEACTVQVSPAQPYVRCDANDDLRVDVSDPVWILNELFGGDNGSRTRCQLASDCNGDGAKDISDAISALSFLFIGGRAPPPPFPGCGTGDEASACESGSTACR